MSISVDLTPAVVDLTFYAGDDGDFKLVFLDTNRVAIDMSAYVLSAQIRKTRESADHTDLTLDMTDAATGVITVQVPSDITRSLVADSWSKSSVWDLQCTSPLVVTLMQGKVLCLQDVTR